MISEYEIFKTLPKPSNLHVHFSSIVPYNLIIDDLNNYYLGKIYIDSDNNLSFYKVNKTSILSKKINKLDTINKKSVSFTDIGNYGNKFYGIIKNIDYFKNYYVKHIIKLMKNHNIYFMDIRLKLGSCIDNLGNRISIIKELDILYKYKNKFNIIIQYNKANKNMYYYFHKIFEKIKNTKYMNIIKGIDLIGMEEYSYTLQYHYDNLLKLQLKYKINFYLHAGEVINSEKSLVNLIYAIKLNSIRIGHGIIAFNNNKLLNKIKNKNIFLELCPISNKLLFDYKLDNNNIINNINNIVICSDDDNKFNTNLSQEFYFLYKNGLELKYIYILLLNSAKFINHFNKIKFDNDFNIFINKLKHI